jgi:hypothetical protein
VDLSDDASAAALAPLAAERAVDVGVRLLPPSLCDRLLPREADEEMACHAPELGGVQSMERGLVRGIISWSEVLVSK